MLVLYFKALNGPIREQLDDNKKNYFFEKMTTKFLSFFSPLVTAFHLTPSVKFILFKFKAVFGLWKNMVIGIKGVTLAYVRILEGPIRG